MEWFNTNISPGETALKQAPEVFESVGVNQAINVFLGMVNDFVGIFLGQSVVGWQRVGIEYRANFDVSFYASLQSGPLSIFHYESANLAATFQCSEHNGLVF